MCKQACGVKFHQCYVRNDSRDPYSRKIASMDVPPVQRRGHTVLALTDFTVHMQLKVQT